MSNWFNQARYGLFIHWGAFSSGARGEWFMNRERISREEYKKLYAENFKAENYNPEEWAQMAKRWGMKYAILTARHHDGFALWDSKVNSFNAAQIGAKRDLVGPYVKAFREAGLKVGLYYSPSSWSSPHYPGAHYRDWPDKNDWASEEQRQNFIDFYRAEIQELLTNYGKIDYIWFDGCCPANIDGDETVSMIRQLQPDILINDRLGKPFDIKNSEQVITPTEDGKDWEACMTLNQHWGYHAGDFHWKSSYDVIEMLLFCAKSAGNLLLNVGPRADGTIPEESIDILDKAGIWIKHNRESLESSERHPFSWNQTTRAITAKGNKVYLHFTSDPSGCFCWGELKNKVLKAYLLDGKHAVDFEQKNDRLFLRNLARVNDLPITVALEIEGRPEIVNQHSFDKLRQGD